VILYHWTTRDKLGSILKTGLDPLKSQGANNVVWLADRERALSMLSHIACHKGIDASKMVLVCVLIHHKKLTKWGRPGVYRSWNEIPPSALRNVSPSVLWDFDPERYQRTD